jgi:hypothetical protein
MATTRTRLLAALLALAMVFSFSAPLAAYADDETDGDTATPAAKVLSFNGTEYTTETIQTDFPAAANALLSEGTSGDVFTVSIDENDAVTLTLQQDYTLPDKTLAIYGDVTLDLNGHTLTTGSESPAIQVSGYSEATSLTLQNGTLTSNALTAIEVFSNATRPISPVASEPIRDKLTTRNVTIDTAAVPGSTALLLSKYSDCTIEDGTQIKSDLYGVVVCGDITYAIAQTNDDAVTLTVNGGSISAKGIAISGDTTKDNTRITINGGEITAENGPAIYHPQLGDLTISGGTITGAMGVQYCGAGTLTIDSASGTEPTIHAVSEYQAFSPEDYTDTSGVVLDGAALSLISRGGDYQGSYTQFVSGSGPVSTPQTMTVSISAGNFISDYNSALQIYPLDDSANYLGDITISGGSFTAAAEDAGNPNQCAALAIDDSAGDAFSASASSGISGGTYAPALTTAYLDYLSKAGVVSVNIDMKTGELTLTPRIALKWSSDLSVLLDDTSGTDSIGGQTLSAGSTLAGDMVGYSKKNKFTGEVGVIYPSGTSAADKAVIAARLSDILTCTTWETDDTRYYPIDPYIITDDGTQIEAGMDLLDYVNNTLLAEPVNSHYYYFTDGIVQYSQGGFTTPVDVDTSTSGSGSGGSSGSGSGSGVGTAVVAMASVAAVGGITLAANWAKLPVHKVQGSLLDGTGAPVANAVVDLEKNGAIVKTVTTDAYGQFKAYVPRGEYNIIATVGDETAVYTAYTPGTDGWASLMLEYSE